MLFFDLRLRETYKENLLSHFELQGHRPGGEGESDGVNGMFVKKREKLGKEEALHLCCK